MKRATSVLRRRWALFVVLAVRLAWCSCGCYELLSKSEGVLRRAWPVIVIGTVAAALFNVSAAVARPPLTIIPAVLVPSS